MCFKSRGGWRNLNNEDLCTDREPNFLNSKCRLPGMKAPVLKALITQIWLFIFEISIIPISNINRFCSIENFLEINEWTVFEDANVEVSKFYILCLIKYGYNARPKPVVSLRKQKRNQKQYKTNTSIEECSYFAVSLARSNN